MLFLISVQSILGSLLQTAILGIAFVRITRAQPRRRTVLFSDKAVIREIDGHYYFLLRIAELQHQQQLVEAHIRLYAVRHTSNFLGSGRMAHFQSYVMRLSHPDDELGGMLLMALPSVVAHRVDDPWSPLVPPTMFACKEEKKRDPRNSYRFPEPAQRAADADAGNRNCAACPTCGEGFDTKETLRAHILFCARDDVVSGWDPKLSCVKCGETFVSRTNLKAHFSENPSHDVSREERDDGEQCREASGRHRMPYSFGEKVRASATNDEEEKRNEDRARKHRRGEGTLDRDRFRHDVETFMRTTQLEIVAIVEGIEPATSDTIQARHSYTADDITWDHTFEPCVVRSESGCVVDYSKFHATSPA